jgi:hypothetical protein
MNTFGAIKTKIEKASVDLYGKKNFKKFIKDFNSIILENKDISEIYYIYDELYASKGIDSSIVDDYINESIEYSQILIENNPKYINNISEWISSIVKENKNNYKDLDNIIYSKSIKDLESNLNSKKNIKTILMSKENKDVKESVNLPLSSMLKIANDSLNREFSNINESDMKYLKDIISLTDSEIITEMKSLKENVISNLNKSINESTESELKVTISDTIKKINESKSDHYNLYKLRMLNKNL